MPAPLEPPTTGSTTPAPARPLLAESAAGLLLWQIWRAAQAINRPLSEPGRPSGQLHADKGHDNKRCPRGLRSRGITTRMAHRGVESNENLGPHGLSVATVVIFPPSVIDPVMTRGRDAQLR
jgi:hypothetical protein